MSSIFDSVFTETQEPELEQKFPVGLTTERRKYLSEEINKFVQNTIKKEFYLNL